MKHCELKTCFDKYIGVLGCDGTPNKCLYLVNRLPGMSSELMDKIADGDRETWGEVWDDALINSINLLVNDVESGMKDGYNAHRFGNVLFRSESPRSILPVEGISWGDNDWAGIVFIAPYSDYMVANFHSVSFLNTNNNENPTSTSLKVWDLFSGEVIHEQFCEVVSGINKIDFVEVIDNEIVPMSLSLESEKHAYFIGIQKQDGIELAKMACNRWKDAGCHSCDPCESIDVFGQKQNTQNFGRESDFSFEIFSGFWSESLITPYYQDITYSQDSIMCLGIDLECSIESFVCKNAKRLSMALQYLVSANLLLMKLTSTRVNYFAKGNLEITKELRQEYESKYKKTLKTILPTLPISGESLCIECASQGIETGSLI